MKADHGVFYVAMDAGVIGGKELNFVLIKSDRPFTSCSHTYTSRSCCDSTGRDIIVRLNASETLHFTSSIGLYSDGGVYINIAIFILAVQTASIEYLSPCVCLSVCVCVCVCVSTITQKINDLGS